MHRFLFASLFAMLSVQISSAALITNPGVAITHTVTVQPIIVSDNDGTNTAEYFGSAAQQLEIEGFIDTIWAQAGIDVIFLNPNSWNNTFANTGDPLNNNPRPGGDLNAVVNAGDVAGVGNVNPNIIDMYFVEIAAGFPDTDVLDPGNGENYANGLAFVGGNGITQHVGDNLVGFTGGREVIASVVAHEIGHNLGLPHIVEFENLMQEGGAPGPGERLSAAQIATALGSSLSISAVPEPSSMALLLMGFGMLVVRRSRD